MAYFAQFALEVEGVAMVTASHNDNGWTGIKMGFARPLTFGPDEMTALKEMVLGGTYETAGGGKYIFVPDMAERYVKALTERPKLKRRLKVVAACGNGTAGAFAPQVLEAIGCEVIPLDAELDYTFPKYNPNPEDMRSTTPGTNEGSQRGRPTPSISDGRSQTWERSWVRKQSKNAECSTSATQSRVGNWR